MHLIVLIYRLGIIITIMTFVGIEKKLKDKNYTEYAHSDNTKMHLKYIINLHLSLEWKSHTNPLVYTAISLAASQ